jgi:hypothetical protein
MEKDPARNHLSFSSEHVCIRETWLLIGGLHPSKPWCWMRTTTLVSTTASISMSWTSSCYAHPAKGFSRQMVTHRSSFLVVSTPGLSTSSTSSRLLSRSMSFSSFGVKLCEHSRTSECTDLRFFWCPGNEQDRFYTPSWTVQVTCSAPPGDNAWAALLKGMLVEFFWHDCFSHLVDAWLFSTMEISEWSRKHWLLSREYPCTSGSQASGPSLWLMSNIATQ